MSEIKTIPERAADGQGQPTHELLPLVYEELRKLAAARMAAESDTSTLQPTALVHEAWAVPCPKAVDWCKSIVKNSEKRAVNGDMNFIRIDEVTDSLPE